MLSKLVLLNRRVSYVFQRTLQPLDVFRGFRVRDILNLIPAVVHNLIALAFAGWRIFNTPVKPLFISKSLLFVTLGIPGFEMAFIFNALNAIQIHEAFVLAALNSSGRGKDFIQAYIRVFHLSNRLERDQPLHFETAIFLKRNFLYKFPIILILSLLELREKAFNLGLTGS